MPESQANRDAEKATRILAVDDEPNIVEFLRVGLGYEGYQVDVAMDGHAALDRLRQETFDLVILDVMLPGVDGFEICKRIRAQSDVPILMLTARDEISDRVLGLDLGADDYLTSPSVSRNSWRACARFFHVASTPSFSARGDSGSHLGV